MGFCRRIQHLRIHRIRVQLARWAGMNKFKKIKEHWVEREIPAPLKRGCREIIWKSGDIHKKQRSGQVVFGITVLILLLFFFYISASVSSTAFWGLGIMAGALVMEMCIEFSMIKKRRFPIDEAMPQFNRQLISYYKTRKFMHFIVTPLLFAAYIYGFIMLLSLFEQELLGELYTYIVYSSWVVFIGLAILIGVQLKKELDILKSLIADDKAS